MSPTGGYGRQSQQGARRADNTRRSRHGTDALRTRAIHSAVVRARIDVPHRAFTKITGVTEQPHLKAGDLFAPLERPTEGRIPQALPSARF